MVSNVNQKAAALTDNDLAEIESKLRQQYRGVFDEKLIALHIREFVESGFADRMASVISRQLPKGASVLDVGCGYGAFVLASRAYGLNATGLELAPFEVEIARRRLGRVEPGTDTSKVILQGNAEHMPFADGQFDAVTLFNVLEHVRDHRAVLREAVRVMRPGVSSHARTEPRFFKSTFITAPTGVCWQHCTRWGCSYTPWTSSASTIQSSSTAGT